ncbi:hypothetical protein [Brevundimonas nasdae]|uniref:Uncharacterized protein n=1 Tax=Brevundimonas nasdae TaxID=172043 RepID=A0ACD4VPT1_9CAUL|nr:hypothetical protein [Brevundimonas nasdae]WOB80091.1 hypothetical protein PZA08_10085 [Brevundimonas nasdae]
MTVAKPALAPATAASTCAVEAQRTEAIASPVNLSVTSTTAPSPSVHAPAKKFWTLVPWAIFLVSLTATVSPDVSVICRVLKGPGQRHLIGTGRSAKEIVMFHRSIDDVSSSTERLYGQMAAGGRGHRGRVLGAAA